MVKYQPSSRRDTASSRRRSTPGPASVKAPQASRHRRVEPADDRLDHTFAALADPTRRAILARLAEDDGVTVGELAEPFAMSGPAVSKHLRVLEKAGLLRQQRDGRVRRCHLEAAALQEANAWVERYRMFWTQQLDSLAAFLEGEAGGAG